METALSRATKKISILDSYILNKIQNQVFVLQEYLNLIDGWQHEARLGKYLKAGEEASRKIQQQLKFAQQYREMGTSLPKWQRVTQVMLFALSHIDTENLSKDFALEGLEIYADAMLESAFVAIFENAILDRAPVHVLRGSYRPDRDYLVLYIEDDGRGVPPDGKEKIFKKPIETNKGLGLFLTREILSLTDITITETGEQGKGGMFEISVPKGAYRFATESSEEASSSAPGNP
jgi:K+-sensing histidine kinase KdpD